MNLRELKNKFYRRILRKKFKNFNSFGSHIPILIGLGILKKPNKVLELGAGLASTPVFLNKSCYPDLKQFTSIENDLNWFEKLKTGPGFRGSANILYYSGRIADYVRQNTIFPYDIILIDDSYETRDRVETIQAVFNSPLSDFAIILIHDFETREYQEAGREWPYRYSFVSYTPNVGILWKNENSMDLNTLRSIYKILERYKWDYSIYDIDKWVEVFERLRKSKSLINPA